MAVSKPPYDPVKVIEGMFNGSVTRIGQALKNPSDYSGSTKTVLAECAKKFHDALDDCEVQLLDAKWYLEHQLRMNRMRREAQAREMGTAVKRKHEETKDVEETNSNEQNVAKKLKVDQVADQKISKEPSQVKETAVEPKPKPNGGIETTKPAPLPIQPEKQKPEVEDQQKPSKPTLDTQSAQPTRNTEASNPSAQEQPPAPLPPADDFAKPTPQATPTGTNDEFNFESMFGEPTGEQGGGSGNRDNDDLDFDFGTGDFGGNMTTDDMGGDQDPPLDTLLPGLESYANQTEDNLLANSNSINNTNTINNTSTSNVQNESTMAAFSNNFDLPSIGGPNIFDDFLNDDNFGGAGIEGGGGDFVDDIDLSNDALLDLDFDSFQ